VLRRTFIYFISTIRSNSGCYTEQLVNSNTELCFAMVGVFSRRVRKIAKRHYELRRVFFFPSVRPHACCTDFHEVSYLGIFSKKAIEKFLDSLNSDKNDRQFTCRPTHIVFIISSPVHMMINVSDKLN
jgi:hypothetical protein